MLRENSDHKIHFDVCSQIDEAKAEHLAFRHALKWGELKEKDAQKRAFIGKALDGGRVGNMAWGNMAMQGVPVFFPPRMARPTSTPILASRPSKGTSTSRSTAASGSS